MKSFFDLSFRYKIPVWGSLLIISTIVAVSGALMVRAYDDMKQDLLTSSADLGNTLAITLYPALLQDDVWRAFEIINAPIKGATPPNVLEPETIVVLDNALQVLVASDPRKLPMLAKLSEINEEFAEVARQLAHDASGKTQVIDLPASQNLFVATPVVDEGNRLGTLLNVHSKNVYLPRFFRVAEHGGLMGLLVLAVLLPLNWYWGQRMTRPLVQIADRMDKLDQAKSTDLDPATYSYDDELGRLFEAYRRMLSEQEKKEALEKQMMQSERLAAVGRLAAGMAHEINNPLGGMLTAIDTLKSHGEIDARTAKTIALIERGLTQIRESVGALLVEARMRSRELEPQDIEDVRSLVAPQAHKKGVRLDWTHTLSAQVPLQASLVRQILINLLLNAIQAADQKGMVACTVEVGQEALNIAVENDGVLLTTDQMAHLFEPFSPLSEHGHGLGLWVTYQIVQQLAGKIDVAHRNGHMHFSVSLPLGDKT